ncbi:MAG: NAD-dependent epimerase/dehydratase family protein [Actinobacteria bacterium]|nr:NAD-dependent epimerase/dehydratase family protein [Actinomycetota bacterium]
MADDERVGDQLTVAVTGVGVLLGRRLVDRLVADDRVVAIRGLDIAPPDDLAGTPKLSLVHADVRDAGFGRHLQDVDVLVHLVFVMDEMDDVNAMRAINVDGTRNVFEAAVEAGVDQVVYTSSYVVYGAHPDNQLPLHEDSPLRVNPDFAYAEHKAEVERWLDGWLPEHQDLDVAVLRLGLVAGPDVDNFIVRAITETVRPMIVKGYRPPVQFAHVEDVADALRHAIDQRLDGRFNVACEGWLSFEEAAQLLGQRSLSEVPEAVAFSVAERLWSMGLALFPPGALHYFMHPFVMSVERMRATGWRPAHTNRETLRQLADEHEGYVTLRRDLRVRRRDLRIGAGLAGGLLLAAALRYTLRRRDG